MFCFSSTVLSHLSEVENSEYHWRTKIVETLLCPLIFVTVCLVCPYFSAVMCLAYKMWIKVVPVSYFGHYDGTIKYSLKLSSQKVKKVVYRVTAKTVVQLFNLD